MMKTLNRHKHKTGQRFFKSLILMGIVIVIIMSYRGDVLSMMGGGSSNGDNISIADYTAYPPFGGTLLKPNVLINLDTSTSQSYFAYDFNYNAWTATWGKKRPVPPNPSAGYTDSTTYYGYFEPDKWYKYTGGEWTTKNATSADWKGNFLNWLTMRRSDIIKKALVGGKTKLRVGMVTDTTDTHAHDLVGDPPFTNTIYVGYQKSVLASEVSAYMPAGKLSGSDPEIFTFDNDEGTKTGWWRRSLNSDDIPAFSIGSSFDSTNQYKTIVHRDTEPEGVIQMVGNNVRWGLEVMDDGQYSDDYNSTYGSTYWKSGGDETRAGWAGCDWNNKWKNTTLNDVNGGTIIIPVGYDNADDMVSAISEVKTFTPATPIAESLWTATGYFAQDSTTGDEGPRYTADRSTWRKKRWRKTYSPAISNAYAVSDEADPYNYALDPSTDTKWAPCAKSFVITITDGEPTADINIPAAQQAYGSTTYANTSTNPPGWADKVSTTAEGSLLNYFWDSGLNGSHYVDNIALYGHVDLGNSYRDLRPGTSGTSGKSITGDDSTKWKQNLTYYFIYATFGGDGAPDARRLMNYSGAAAGGAARNGGFTDSDGNFEPDQQSEYDADNDGNNDNFFDAKDGYQIEAALTNAIYDAIKQASSGTSAGMLANAGAADGVFYQAYFYDEKDGRKWLGNIKALKADGTSGWDGGKYLWQTKPGDRTIYTTTDGSDMFSFKTTNYSTTLKAYLRAADQTEAENIINWVRGYDFTDDVTGNDFKAYTTDAGHPDGYRQRSITIDSDTNVWKLGDIINSSPTVVGEPVENYDLLYGDSSYTAFRSNYLKRSQVVYVGANDGMLHAFDAGSGEELWAFIPRGLLPHLKWLTDPGYTHVYYVDLKPKITDARIFTDDTTHVNGWGTILIGGFRYGGKNITCPAPCNSASPEYFALDITDPADPQLLWTFSDPGLGLSMTYPSVARACDSDKKNCKWFAIFGSGATDYDAFSNLTNFQAGNIFVLEISGGTDGVISSWTENTDFWKISTGNSDTFMSDPITVDVDTDYDVDGIYFGENYTDGSNWNALLRRITTGKGTQNTPSAWTLSTVANINTIAGAKDTAKKLTAAPSVAMDNKANLWVFFGTGQFLGASDKNQTDTGAFYAIRDGCWKGGTGCPASYTSLLDISEAVVNIDGSVQDITPCDGTTVSTWGDLLSASYNCDGWAMYFNNLAESADFTNTSVTNAAGDHGGERMISKPLVIGGLVTWTTFIPEDSVCSSGGVSNLYAIYYKTGSAYQNYVFRGQKNAADLVAGGETTSYDITNIARVKRLDGGVLSSVSAQMTSGGGTMGFAQQVTGSILEIESITPISLKSETIGWANRPIP